MEHAAQTQKRPPRVYVEPTSIENAKDRHRDLVHDLNVIQMQMGDETRKARMTASEFAEWRRKAMGARINKIDEIIWLKNWIRAQRALRDALVEADRSDPTQLIVVARNVLRDLKEDGVELDENEIAIFNALDEYVNQTA